MLNLPNFSDTVYWNLLRSWAKDNSDGCTGVKDWYLDSCYEHDFHHMYGVTLYGDPISFNQTNSRLRQVIQMKSKLGWFSPLSYIRYAGTSVFGKRIWDRHRKANLPAPIKIMR